MVGNTAVQLPPVGGGGGGNGGGGEAVELVKGQQYTPHSVYPNSVQLDAPLGEQHDTFPRHRGEGTGTHAVVFAG